MSGKKENKKNSKQGRTREQMEEKVFELNQLSKQLKGKLTSYKNQLSTDLKRSRKLLDITENIILAIDSEENISFINEQGCKILGYKQNELTGSNWFDKCLPADVRDSVRGVFKKVLSGEIEHSEYFRNPVLTSAGKRKIISWHNSVLKDSDGNVDSVLCSGEDVTEYIKKDSQLQLEHKMLTGLMNGLPDIVFIKDGNGIFLMANQALAEIVGLSDSRHIVGKNVFDIFPEHVAELLDNDEKKLLKTGQERVDRELTLTGYDGNKVWLSKTILPLKDKQGNVTNIIGIARDITKPKELNEKLQATNQQLEASEQQMRAANQQLKTSEQQLVAANQQLQDGEQQLRAYNQQLQASHQQLRAANQQLDASNQQLRASEQELARLTQNLKARTNELECLYGLSRLAQDRNNSLAKIFTGMFDLIKNAWKHSNVTEMRIIYDNHTFETPGFTERGWLQSSNIKVGGKSRGKIQVCYSRKRDARDEGPFSENERKLLNTIAEHIGEIAERKQVEKSREKVISQLKQKNAELERFTYAVSHDLKSPLITIKGFIGMLEKDIKAQDTEQMKSDMSRISKAADKMSLLLDELLDLSRVGRRVSSPSKVNLGELAGEAVDLIAGQINKHNVEVEIADEFPDVLGDRSQLLTVFQNLLDNAVKFCSDTANPRVEIGFFVRKNEYIYFIKDNGIGLNEKHYDKIFGLFDKLDNKTEGTGVGLALVKRIIEVHGGRIWVESEGEGRGSTFYFTIPSHSKLGKGEDEESQG
jgi:PAS domain S-box-containing protein